MCGICGQFNFQSRQPVVETLIRAATHTLAHRGPDDEGFFFSGPVGLGFRRLSIIDLGLGRQPMSDESGSICLVFNGEIYNYRELRRQLATFGHRFRTSSDTEVIVYGYKQWGDKVFDHLNGMFGLAIWDGTRQRLVLARDAMGIKPVYYTVTNGGICFGSEIRAVTRMLRGDVALDSTSLNLFLRYRYTPSPLTLFTGIRKLAPGTMAVVDQKGVRVERWYQFKPSLHAPTKTFREAKHELLGLYRDAVRRHLISDVPVGLLLSAGIDSGLLLALMNDEGGGRPTYTVGYGPSFPDDELVAAALTAAHFKTRHVSVKLTPESFERYLPAVVRSLEEPVAAASIVPMFAVCERARQDVKVALVGQGPDELFGGYPRHLGVYYGEYWRRLPASVRRLGGACLARLPRSAGIKRGLFALDLPDRTRRYQNAFSILRGHTVDGLFRDGVLEPGAGDTILDCWSGLEMQMGGTDELAAFQLLEVRSSLPDELLLYADKLSMAHGLEVRVPYLDREVVEYAQCLRSDLKIRWHRQKYLHRKICSSFLPADVTRRKKLGFAGNVVDGWFRRSVSARLDELLLDGNSRMYCYLRPEAVGALLQAHRAGVEDHHKILFSLVVLEMWLRTSMESTRTDSRSEPGTTVASPRCAGGKPGPYRREFSVGLRKHVIVASILCAAISSASVASAKTITARTCSQTDVQNALANAQDGDTVVIPAGTCTWTGTGLSMTLAKSVTIQGAGAIYATAGGAGTAGSDRTTIIYNNSTLSALKLVTAAGKSLRITALAFLMNGSSRATNDGVLDIAGKSSAVRVDHCHFYINSGSTILGLHGSVTGVVDHNNFESPSGALTTPLGMLNGQTWGSDTQGYGDGSWTDTEHWGSSQFLFIEDNRFHNGDIGDGNSGAARYVFRHNTVTIDALTSLQGMMFNHGLTSARGRSTRAMEVYQNTFTQPGAPGVNSPTWAVNGGTLLYWGNSITQYRYAVTIDYTRKDNGTYPYGTPPSGWGNCMGTSGTVWDGPGGYPCMDGPGRGAGDMVSGSPISSAVNTRTGTQASVQQALSPIYVWGNTFTAASGYSPTAMVSTGTSMIQANREYYSSVGASCSGSDCLTGVGSGTRSARPPGCTTGVGYWATDESTLYVCSATNTWRTYYTPFRYPHPLVVGSTPPAPPTDVRIIR